MGGVPASLGGGGLEHQAQQTAEALRRRGHAVFRVEQEATPRAFDLLHAFGANQAVGELLLNWRRNPAPLVLSPVVVVRPGVWEWRQHIMGHLPIPQFGPRLRHQLVCRADLVVAQTEHEAQLLRAWCMPASPHVVTIPNGVTPLPAAAPSSELPSGYVLLLGSVSARKNQLATVAALGQAQIPTVIAGGFEGDRHERAEFETAVKRADAHWLGEVRDRAVVAGLLRGARALVHLSLAEGQSLAILEALSVGTPAVLSSLPANRELGRSYPDLVRLVTAPEDVAHALGDLPVRAQPAPIPTWDEIASRLEAEYRRLLS